LVKALAVDRVEADLIMMAARIHDIGKVDISVDILRKAGTLTAADRALIEMHPDLGADMVHRYPDFRRGADMVRYHHESWNGAGYPRGLRATAIPFGARVIAVADSYDAMTSDRPYRKGMTPAQAAAVLRRGRGVQWDPEIVESFLRILPDMVAQISPSRLHLVRSLSEEAALAIAQ
jgi:HD-GYP domain-containing protein (c-di-GMP phosphodiesterase class II)